MSNIEQETNFSDTEEQTTSPSLKSFLLSAVFYKNLFLAIIITVILLLLTDFGVKIYTDHGKVYPVPSLIGKTLEEVKIITQKAEMKFEIIDSAHAYNYPKLTILKQTPNAYSMVKKNRTIKLVINASSAKVIGMPNLINISESRVNNILKSNKLKLGEVSYKPHISKNVVISQKFKGEDIVSETPIEENSVIDIIIGSGLGDKKIRVPNLIGLTIKEVKSQLEDVNLNLGAIVSKDSIRESFEVTKQYPSSSSYSQIREGAQVDIWVAEKIKLETDSTTIIIEE